MTYPRIVLSRTVGLSKLRLEALNQPKVFYATGTVWWTHDPNDLHMLNGPDGIPTCPLGSPLLMTNGVTAFLNAAVSNAPHYGAHGLDAFLAAHAKNCYAVEAEGCEMKPTSIPVQQGGWVLINQILDEQGGLL